MLEDGDEDAVRGADREQVERDGGRGDHERPEREQQQHEREPEHEQEHVREPRPHLVVEVVGAGGHARHRHLDAGQRLRDRRDHRVAQRVQRGDRGRVVAVSGDREVDPRDRPVGVHADRERREQLAGRERALPEEVVGVLHLRACRRSAP